MLSTPIVFTRRYITGVVINAPVAIIVAPTTTTEVVFFGGGVIVARRASSLASELCFHQLLLPRKNGRSHCRRRCCWSGRHRHRLLPHHRRINHHRRDCCNRSLHCRPSVHLRRSSSSSIFVVVGATATTAKDSIVFRVLIVYNIIVKTVWLRRRQHHPLLPLSATVKRLTPSKQGCM